MAPLGLAAAALGLEAALGMASLVTVDTFTNSRMRAFAGASQAVGIGVFEDASDETEGRVRYFEIP